MPTRSDLALAYDAVNARMDVVFRGRDFVLDSTLQTPVLMSLGCQRRAHPDDRVPSEFVNPPADLPLTNTRGGWAGDALDGNGELTGSRQYTLYQSKLDDIVVPQLAQAIDAEALDWLNTRLGYAISVSVQKYNSTTLAHRVVAGGQQYSVPQLLT